MKSEKTILGLIAAAILGLIATESTAQIFGNRYAPAVCQNCQPIQPIQPTALPVPEGVTEVASAVADGPHCRCLVNGSCGSGTICGADASGSYVLSNAHVWGTQIGKAVTIDIVSGGATKRLQGRLVFSGYSNSRMVDFAIAKVEGLSSKKYMPLSKTEPTAAPYGTRGSPQCVWPQVTKPFNDPRNYGQGLITGLPDAIGGQSGSAIYNSTGKQIALLTWSINGRCAGQKTSLLWKVAQERNVQLADARPEGLRELCDDPAMRPITDEGVFGDFPVLEIPVAGEKQRPVTEEGISGELPIIAAAEQAANDLQLVGPRKRPVTENVVASIMSTSLKDVPIWDTPGVEPPPPPPPGECPEGCYKLSQKEWELIEFLRNQRNETASGERALTPDQWMKLIQLVLEIIKALQKPT